MSAVCFKFRITKLYVCILNHNHHCLLYGLNYIIILAKIINKLITALTSQLVKTKSFLKAMPLKFTSLNYNQFSPRNTKFCANIFKNNDVIDILVWVGLACKLAGLQYLCASCRMHAISRYCETRLKIID